MRTQQERCYHHPLRIGRLSAGGIATNTTQTKNIYLNAKRRGKGHVKKKTLPTEPSLPLIFGLTSP